MAKPPKRGAASRTRTLSDFNRKFPISVEDIIKQTSAKRLLEIGPGEGRVMMELAKLYPYIEIHGINKKPWPAMSGQKSLKVTGTNYNIFTLKEIEKINMPKMHFYSAEKLNFPNNYFDVAISQVAIYQIKRKDLALEEIWRVLKPKGRALLHIDTHISKFSQLRTSETPRFEIERTSLRGFVKILQNKGYDIHHHTYKENEWGVDKKRVSLILKKNKPKLDLRLKFEEKKSYDFKRYKTKNIVGFKSVYSLS